MKGLILLMWAFAFGVVLIGLIDKGHDTKQCVPVTQEGGH